MVLHHGPSTSGGRGPGYGKIDCMSTITELLNKNAVALGVKADDWRGAIATAGRLLEEAGDTDRAYTEDMITSVEDNGPYIVVAPGFAFAHARPSPAVHRTSMSWVRLAEPVEFGHPKNDPVTLVVALAAKDSAQHTAAMAQLAKLVGNRETRQRLDSAATPEEILEIIGAAAPPQREASSGASRSKILTVCGNGLGTSLFLKNTLEEVLSEWGWARHITVEATDTISAKGKAKEADLILTSGEIAKTLGDVGIPTYVITNFTSTDEIDHALRDLYDV